MSKTRSIDWGVNTLTSKNRVHLVCGVPLECRQDVAVGIER